MKQNIVDDVNYASIYKRLSDHSDHCDAAKDYTEDTFKLKELVYTSKDDKAQFF